ncbi:MAG: SDR family NAD(P)-dependent oxidoreductase [Caldimonas sp.]
MTMPLMKPRRKNPVLRTRQMNLPPWARGRTALGMTAAAAEGRFELQVCQRCQAVQYPPRDACHRCLSPQLRWMSQTGTGELLSETVLHHSNDPFYRERLPWRLGLVRLDVGPTVIVHLHGDVPSPSPSAHGGAPQNALPAAGRPAGAPASARPQPVRVHVGARLDRAGAAVLIGFPPEESEHMADDNMLREMTSDPKFRKILVTDGKTEVGQALVKALVKAGADIVWVGHAEPWKKLGGLDDISALKPVTLVPLDLTNGRSVTELAGEIGGKVDIVINNAEVHRAFGIAARRGTDVAKAEMDINYFGLLRLAQEFGPALKGRSADGVTHAAAWVNLLSIYALSNYPPHGTFSASKAAAHSLAQCLRAEMRPTGIRVINVFPGPIDDEWNQNLPPPKVTPAALASAIVRALKEGIEDVYPGDVAQEWVERWRDNPKVLERELAAGG